MTDNPNLDDFSCGTEQEILALIDEATGYTVHGFADELDTTVQEVQSALENLMECGKITSTPDWKYRLSRRSQHKDGEHLTEG